jgi:cob(I)alamin adenosyltransferase
MSHRLTRIATRTGDNGTTGLADGSRTTKDAPRIEAMGAVDELNSTLGLLLTEPMPDDVRELLTDIQHDLFDLGGELAVPGHALLTAAQVARLDAGLERFNSTLSPLKEFVLPGGTRAAAIAHLARTACRRAERALVALSHDAALTEFALPFVNRLSDLLFVLARVLNRFGGREDVYWQQGKNRGEETR